MLVVRARLVLVHVANDRTCFVYFLSHKLSARLSCLQIFDLLAFRNKSLVALLLWYGVINMKFDNFN